MNPAVRRFTVLGRKWCHLCEHMLEALEPIAREFDWEIEWLDVDEDDELEAKWGLLIPVLLADGIELCHYRLDVSAVRTHCRRFPLESGNSL